MKIEMHNATNCPVPQFVVRPEGEEERMLLKAFFGVYSAGGWRFGLHGTVHSDGGITSFNFGLIRVEADPIDEPLA